MPTAFVEPENRSVDVTEVRVATIPAEIREAPIVDVRTVVVT